MFYQILNRNEKYHPITLQYKLVGQIDKSGKFYLAIKLLTLFAPRFVRFIHLRHVVYVLCDVVSSADILFEINLFKNYLWNTPILACSLDQWSPD